MSDLISNIVLHREVLPQSALHAIDPDDQFFNEVYGGLKVENESKYYSVENYNSAFDNSFVHFDVMTFNIRSYNKNVDSFMSVLECLYKSPEILVLTETWLTIDDQSTCSVEGYNEFHTVRHAGRGGGVSVLCADILNARLIPHLSVSNLTIETCVVHTVLKNQNLVVFAVYRPHSDSIENFNGTLLAMLHDQVLKGKQVMLIGDINVDLLKCDSNYISAFVDTMQSVGFLPVITKATRFPPGDSHGAPSLLDHIWINRFDRYVAGIISIDNTDHCPAFIKFPMLIAADNKVKLSFRTHKVEQIEQFKNIVHSIVADIDFLADGNSNTSRLVHDLNKAYIRCFPVKVKFVSKKRIQKQWITPGILKSIKTKSRYFKLCKLGLISEQLNRKYKNCLNSVIRQAKRNYFINSFNSNQSDIKKTWSVIKQLLAKKSKANSVKSLIVNDTEITESSEIAEHFNNYFTEIAQTLDNQLPTTDQSPYLTVINNNLSSAFFRPTTTLEINNIIINLKNKSSKLNEMPVWLFKDLRSVLAEPISKLINSSISSGVFPDCLKCARVVPIYKKGETTNMSNYRPIAILPTLSKIFEKTISTRLLNFLEKSNIIIPRQFGFLRGRSTADSFLSLMEYIYEGLNNKKHSIGIFIDLTKAFDTVKHDVLLGKLERYGVRGLPLQWLTSYLRDRRQYVTFNGCSSSERIINVAVPQGSILGPLLFLVYINDMPNASSSLLSVLYADDTTLLASDSNYRDLVRTVNEELPKIQNWCLANRLSISMDKTYAMIFTNKPNTITDNDNIFLNNESVKIKTNENFLGLILDDQLKFVKHIQFVCKKVSKTVGLLYSIKHYIPHKILINLYYSLVYPYFLYANLIWGGACHSHLAPLVILQKRLIRVINKAQFLAHTEPLFKHNKILKIDDLHSYILALNMYKQNMQNGEMFQTVHEYNTRGRNNAQQTFQRLTQTQQSITFAGPRAWNRLPVEIRNSASLKIFKKRVKIYYLDKYTDGNDLG